MTCLQPTKVDAEWKPEYVFTVIFGNTNQIKWDELPEKIKEFKPATSKFFPTRKDNITISVYVFEQLMVELCLQHDKSLDITFENNAHRFLPAFDKTKGKKQE